jgi:hypothetical protein
MQLVLACVDRGADRVDQDGSECSGRHTDRRRLILVA